MEQNFIRKLVTAICRARAQACTTHVEAQHVPLDSQLRHREILFDFVSVPYSLVLQTHRECHYMCMHVTYGKDPNIPTHLVDATAAPQNGI
jgi:hypothetical protein